MKYYFPFGQPLKKVEQIDRTNKDVFVLGVYASAVHAKWTQNGKIICQALAVTSEPYIFWDGNIDEAKEIISKINLPKAAGELQVSNHRFNGPSGRVLIEKILRPLGYTRENAWLCDLVPESRMNLSQKKVIENKYNLLIEELGLNEASIPESNNIQIDDIRIKEITDEIIKSNANVLILLGDEPIKKYLKHVVKNLPFRDLKQYTDIFGYGNKMKIEIEGHTISIIPIAHPRNIGELGKHSTRWFMEHKKWEERLRVCNKDKDND